ncbi:hypothetical protein [Mycetocola sp.]|uniref:hypothetical protein n=1 Tax=Mycetocola sp. TaxID=1871042 RepID=UPI003988FD5F
MRSLTWPGSDRESARVAVLLPGTGYTVQAPLLYWSAELLAQQGWRVEAVEWMVSDEAQRNPRAFVEAAVDLAFATAPGASRRLVVGKSFGSFALPWAIDSKVPGIWLTPVLTDLEIYDALAAAASSHLAIGGGADPMWAPSSSLTTGAQLTTLEGADHSLLLDGDWHGSIALHAEVLEIVARRAELLAQ